MSDSISPNRILMGQRVWRTISLENKQNIILFNSGNSCNQIGFFEIIKFGLFEKKQNAFWSDDFSNVKNARCSLNELIKKISFIDSAEVTAFDGQGNEKKEMVVTKRYLFNKDVNTYLIKEDWIFNSYSAQLEKRLVALAPLLFDKRENKIFPLFWLYYDEWKELFDLFEAKNYYTESKITYKDVLEKKYFISQVSKESNVFDRILKSNKHGQDAYTESELIKEKILNAESDLFQH
jgi:hypothetical protein